MADNNNNTQSRQWIITLNLAEAYEFMWAPATRTQALLHFSEQVCEAGADGRAFVGQMERGEAGNYHLQFALQFPGRVRLAQVRSHIMDKEFQFPEIWSIPESIVCGSSSSSSGTSWVHVKFPAPHAEARRGTVQQMLAYCSKSDTRVSGTYPVEWGEFEVAPVPPPYGALAGLRARLVAERALLESAALPPSSATLPSLFSSSPPLPSSPKMSAPRGVNHEVLELSSGETDDDESTEGDIGEVYELGSQDTWSDYDDDSTELMEMYTECTGLPGCNCQSCFVHADDCQCVSCTGAVPGLVSDSEESEDEE